MFIPGVDVRWRVLVVGRRLGDERHLRQRVVRAVTEELRLRLVQLVVRPAGGPFLEQREME